MSSGWNQSVWELVSCIPHGKVTTYGQIAAMLGFPRRGRQVGFALHKTPEGLVIPWHRVINASGRISFPEDSHRYLLQRVLLAGEDIQFEANDRVDLKTQGWRP